MAKCGVSSQWTSGNTYAAVPPTCPRHPYGTAIVKYVGGPVLRMVAASLGVRAGDSGALVHEVLPCADPIRAAPLGRLVGVVSGTFIVEGKLPSTVVSPAWAWPAECGLVAKGTAFKSCWSACK